MSLRQKLLLLLSLMVAVVVAAVAWTVLIRVRQVFEQRDQEETALFVSQFQREFQQRSAEVAAAVDRVANSERVRNVAFELAQSNDPSPYLTEAQTLAQEAHLDFLEILAADGSIVSSAQWPARFGYPEPALGATQSTFLKTEDLPDGSSKLGLFALRAVHRAEAAGSPVRILGGKLLDPSFLADLPVAPGMSIALYSEPVASSPQNQQPFDPIRLISASGPVENGNRFQSLIDAAHHSGQQISATLYLTSRREDSVNATAIPLKSDNGSVLAVLLVSISRGSMVQAQQHIRAIAYGVAAGGILLAILLSLWIAARVSRPIEQLARAAEEVAAGNWEAHVPERGRPTSRDEIAALARSFNHMTAELVAQRDRLVQTERVAAWRELARRLAHELKNPLFPLQLTVENLVRARGLSAEEFDEVFRESTQTLSMEIANLKTIIARFSDFSRMPKPQLERIDANDTLRRVAQLYLPGGMSLVNAESAEVRIQCNLELAPSPLYIEVDPELLHRALSNLVLNAQDAMPDGGTLTLSAVARENKAELRVADTGEGLTPEECERLFTPYYTTRQHGTGLGLAIVQSVVADHNGSIAVESKTGEGATFVITLPRADESTS
jgi:signal transduction histidine kinase